MAAAAGCSIRMFQTHMLNQTASSLRSGKPSMGVSVFIYCLADILD